jgi:uncharacterized membrane protein YphA (DoxX/SURF4 family)
MNDSMAQRRPGIAPLDLPSWKTALSWTSALLIALLFLASGLWKLTDAQSAAMRMAQAKVPESLSLAAAIVVGILETFGAVLILVPRFRRWGAYLTSALLVAFMIYIGVHYNALRGEECSCFPILKRAVGPMFFAGDAAMLVLAACAGLWARRPEGLRNAFVVLGAVTVFAMVSYGAVAVRQTGTKAPDTITVAGQPYSLRTGKFLLFFFNPTCSHCFDAAKRMAQYSWKDTKIVAVPVEMAQFAQGFLDETKLNAVITSDFDTLKDTFGYKAYPFAVAIEHGREKGPLTRFEDDEPASTLRSFGFIR